MEIRDDGRGFDPDAVVPAEDGESESASLACASAFGCSAAGSRSSAPGGPTTVRATLPHWLPLAQSA